MQLLFCYSALRRNFLAIGKGYLKQAHSQEIVTKLAKTFPHEPVQNHAQVKDKWEKLKKKYIAKKKARVTRNAPSKWCWFDRIDQILASIVKADGLPGGKIWGYQRKFPSH
jgi:hypothetical protein